MVQQAWDKYRRDQLLISCTPASLRETLATKHIMSYKRAIREVFVAESLLLRTAGLGG